MKLSGQSTEIMRSVRSQTLSTLASLSDISISEAIQDGPAAFPMALEITSVVIDLVGRSADKSPTLYRS